MVDLELTTAEAEILMTTLAHTISDLRMEISHTDQMDFREGLKHRKEVLMAIHDRLRPPAAQFADETYALLDA